MPGGGERKREGEKKRRKRKINMKKIHAYQIKEFGSAAVFKTTVCDHYKTQQQQQQQEEEEERAPLKEIFYKAPLKGIKRKKKLTSQAPSQSTPTLTIATTFNFLLIKIKKG